MTTQNTEGQVVFDIGIGTLSSNKELFIHAGTYTTGRQQQGTIRIKEKNSQGDGTTFKFGPKSSGRYAEMLNETYAVKDDTFYEVTVNIENEQGNTWDPSKVKPMAGLSAGNFHEVVVTSEDSDIPDDVNDTVVRLVWFTKPNE